MSKKLKILSLDGGGIRGIIPAILLAEIEARSGKRIADLFDLIVGTSTGGIIAAGLNVPHRDDPTRPQFSAGELAGLYLNNGAKIFEKRIGLGVLDESYNHEFLLGLLKDYFRNSELKDSLCDLMITSYDIERRKPFYFKKHRAIENPESENFKLWEVARSTSAAPTYFEPNFLNWQKNDHLVLIDGGVFANNPAMLAYTEAINLQRRRAANADKEFVPAIRDATRPTAEPDFFMLSIGTGRTVSPYLHNDAKNWGLLGWARPIVDILMQGVSESVDYQMQYILQAARSGQPNYYRINPLIPDAHSDMANGKPDNVAALKQIAIDCTRQNSEKIDAICEALTGPRTN